MPLTNLQIHPEFKDSRTLKLGQNFGELLTALDKITLPDTAQEVVNQHIVTINSFEGGEKDYRKAMSAARYNILKYLEKEHKLVPKNHYQKTWLALGLAAFGIPLGAAMGAALGNMAFMGVGIAMGLPIGLAVGKGLDKKAKQEGRQFDYERI